MASRPLCSAVQCTLEKSLKCRSQCSVVCSVLFSAVCSVVCRFWYNFQCSTLQHSRWATSRLQGQLAAGPKTETDGLQFHLNSTKTRSSWKAGYGTLEWPGGSEVGHIALLPEEEGKVKGRE